MWLIQINVNVNVLLFILHWSSIWSPSPLMDPEIGFETSIPKHSRAQRFILKFLNNYDISGTTS